MSGLYFRNRTRQVLPLLLYDGEERLLFILLPNQEIDINNIEKFDNIERLAKKRILGIVERFDLGYDFSKKTNSGFLSLLT